AIGSAKVPDCAVRLVSIDADQVEYHSASNDEAEHHLNAALEAKAEKVNQHDRRRDENQVAARATGKPGNDIHRKTQQRQAAPNAAGLERHQHAQRENHKQAEHAILRIELEAPRNSAE